jgi:hypothetical protein
MRHERRRRGRERQERPDRVGHGAEISLSGLDVLAELRRDSRRGATTYLSDKRNKHRGRRLGARRSDYSRFLRGPIELRLAKSQDEADGGLEAELDVGRGAIDQGLIFGFPAQSLYHSGIGALLNQHDEIGRIVVPTAPLRVHGADPLDTVPSPKLGQHNREIYGDWLGLSAAEIAELEQDGVI